MNGLAGLTGNAILDHAFALLMVLARVGATFALMPGLGETTIPATVKAGLILILSLLLLPAIEPALPPRPDSELGFGLLIATETVDGLWFGWLARVLTTSLPMAGQFIAEFAGLSNIVMPSPDLGGQTSAISRMFEVAVPVMILSTGLYTYPLAALAGYYRLVPPGSVAWVPDSASMTITVVGQGFSLAVQLSAPFILASVAWNVAIGLCARLVPKLQIFFVALPGQIWLSLLLLSLLAVPLLGTWMEAMRSGLSTLPGAG